MSRTIQRNHKTQQIRPSIIVHELPTEDGVPMGARDWTVEASFRKAVEAFQDQVPDADTPSRWQYVQIIFANDLNNGELYCGNNGAQGWRHRDTGITIPDWCRQQDGTPEIWTTEAARAARKLEIAGNSPIFNWLVDW